MPERDRAIERPLRRVLSAHPTATAATPCLDAEQLAAWADGHLRGAAAGAVEQHLGACRRCQAMSAAVIRTAPALPPRPSAWSRWRLRWLVPLATAAAAASLWVAIPERPSAPGSVARSIAVPPPASPAPDSAVPSSAGRETAASPAPAAPREPGAAAAATGTASRQPSLERFEATRMNQDSREAPAQPAAPTAAAEAGAAPSADALGDRAQAPPAAESSADGPGAENSLAKALGSPRLGLQSVAGLVEIPVTGSPMRWRIVAGRVERSTSPGVWEAVAIDSAQGLTAGSAPSEPVCWLVGRDGRVYLASDARGFRRLPFPEAIDLTAVAAADERTATVTAVDGRTWRTTSQGEAWTPLP